MASTPSQYTKAPKRKGDKGRRVVLSDEAKKAYEEMMKKRDSEADYRSNLDPNSRRV